MSGRGPALGRPPARLLVPAAVAVVFLGLPMVAVLAATPWADFLTRLTDPAGDATAAGAERHVAQCAEVREQQLPLKHLSLIHI